MLIPRKRFFLTWSTELLKVSSHGLNREEGLEERGGEEERRAGGGERAGNVAGGGKEVQTKLGCECADETK